MRRRLLFLPTVLLLIGGMIAGVVQSLRFDARLPRVELDYGWYLNALRQRGDHAGFVHGMEVALAIDDGLDDASGEKILGGLYTDERRYVEASEHYQRAARLNPHDAETQLLLGTSLLQLNRFQEAIPHLQRARDLQPDAPEIRLNLGLALAQDQQLQDAIVEFNALVQLQPQNARHHVLLAQALYNGGRSQEAAVHCEEARRLAPDDPQLRTQCEKMAVSQP
jgi:Flp pilus assembly protein TadD